MPSPAPQRRGSPPSPPPHFRPPHPAPARGALASRSPLPVPVHPPPAPLIGLASTLLRLLCCGPRARRAATVCRLWTNRRTEQRQSAGCGPIGVQSSASQGDEGSCPALKTTILRRLTWVSGQRPRHWLDACGLHDLSSDGPFHRTAH
eukprot:538125-Prorocentrum_minimum.AAC.1